MAGSAINLGGMLSQMGNSMGSMGQSVGKSMFQPMIYRQVMEKKQEMILEAENRAERRQIEGESRRAGLAEKAAINKEDRLAQAKEAARLEALGRSQAEKADLQGPQLAAAKAVDNDDPIALQAAIDQMKEMAIKYPDSGAQAGVVALQEQMGTVRNKGAMRELQGIDKVLNSQDPNIPESVRLAHQQRKAVLLGDGEVDTLYKARNAALDKASDAQVKRKIDLRKAQSDEEVAKENTAIKNYTAAVVGGRPMDDVPDTYKPEVTKAVAAYKENMKKVAEIEDYTQPLPADVVKWAVETEGVDALTRQAALDIQSGKVVNPIGARKQISTAYLEYNSYARDKDRRDTEKGAELSSMLRVEETLKHSATFGLGTDVLEALQEVPVADRADDPLWQSMAHIAKTNPEITGRELAEKLVAARPQDSGRFNEESIDLGAGEAIVSTSLKAPSVQAWGEKHPELYRELETEIAKEAQDYVQHRKAAEAGKQTGRNDVDYTKPFKESKVLREILLKYELDKA